jgi:hypothetical protein
MAADRRLLTATFAAIALFSAGPARAAVDRPTALAPAARAISQFLPAFAWTPVSGADKYQFQIRADAGMNSPVLGDGKDDFFTRNTRATLVQTVPNGTYYWRVRAVGPDGSVSGWTPARPFTKNWTLQPGLQAPANGQSLSFPANPVVLRWSGIPGAAHYLVSVASDPALGSLVFRYSNQDDPNGPPNVAANSAAISNALAVGTYYWGVVPVDAEGNRGVPTPVASFGWVWPSATAVTVTDLDSSQEVFDPKFSWNPVPGAARYEVEVNPSADFAPGSKVCCSGSTIATSLSPSKVFEDDIYHWRVRAIDPDGNAGVWNVGQDFQKTFDNVPPVDFPSIKNLHMRDNVDNPGTDLDPGTPGYQTEVPVVTWDPVHGAASYEVDVAPYESSICNWSAPASDHHWRVRTAVPAWTPLGNGWNNVKPYSDPMTVGNDGSISLVPGSYCVRVRARTDRDTHDQDVYGDYTYLEDDTGNGTAFNWTGYPPAVSAGCNGGYPCAGDYLAPVTGTINRQTPYFTWNSMSGAQSYFVLVSRDANFTSLVDYGFTHVPAYAPRTANAARTYPDETTLYYWAVLPAQHFDGSLSLGNPLLAAADNFQKQSLPPSLLYPAASQVFYDQPTFRWSPTDGARRYRFEVASDASFSNLLDDVTTDATSYSSNNTYPADTVLYWRVRADDETLTGLTWSAMGMFQKKLSAPVPSSQNPRSGDMLPVWAWAPVQGASSYDISVDGPDGRNHYFSGFRTPAVSFIKMTGTGVFHWRVRAEFPSQSGTEIPGPYSATQAFTRTIGEPVNQHTDSNPDHVLLSWDPKVGVKQYKVQIAATPDFSRRVEETTTDNAIFAPLMTQSGYAAGGTLYWRVAGVDEDRNQGDWSQPGVIQLLPRMRLSVSGLARHGKRRRFTVRVQKYGGGGWVAGVRVRVTGPGMKPKAGRTNASGKLVFTLRPRRRGRMIFRATKAGYQSASLTVRVR